MNTYKASVDVTSVIMQIIDHIYTVMKDANKPLVTTRTRPVNKYSTIEVNHFGDDSNVTQVRVTGTLLHPLNFNFNIDGQQLAGLVITAGGKTYTTDMHSLITQIPVLKGLFMDLVGTIKSERERAVSPASLRLVSGFRELTRLDTPPYESERYKHVNYGGDFEGGSMSIRNTAIAQNILRNSAFSREKQWSPREIMQQHAPCNCGMCRNENKGLRRTPGGTPVRDRLLSPREFAQVNATRSHGRPRGDMDDFRSSPVHPRATMPKRTAKSAQHLDYDGETIGSLSELSNNETAVTHYYQNVDTVKGVKGFLSPLPGNDRQPVLLLNKRLYYVSSDATTKPLHELPLVLFDCLYYTTVNDSSFYLDNIIPVLGRCPVRLAGDIKTLTGFNLLADNVEFKVKQINAVIDGHPTTPGIIVTDVNSNKELAFIRRPDSNVVDLVVEMTDVSSNTDERFPISNRLDTSKSPIAIEWYQALSMCVNAIFSAHEDANGTWGTMEGHMHFGAE